MQKQSASKCEKIIYLTIKAYNPERNSLNLSHCTDNIISEYDWVQVLKDRQWNFLKILILQKCKVSVLNLQVFLNIQLSNLVKLHLDVNKIGNGGYKLLIKADLPQLKFLSIQKTGINDQHIKILIKSRWPNLSMINVCNTGLYDIKKFNRIGLNGCCYLSMNGWAEMAKIWTELTNGQLIGVLNIINMGQQTVFQSIDDYGIGEHVIRILQAKYFNNRDIE